MTGGVEARDAATEAAAVVHPLVERGETLAVVESLTGGLLAATIVDVAGASSVFRGGLVVYATDLKESLAGVPADLLAARGPVDPDVAIALAEGGRWRCGADWCLATTGVAGPESQNGRPVGLVFVALAGPAGAQVRELRLGGGRDQIRSGHGHRGAATARGAVARGSTATGTRLSGPLTGRSRPSAGIRTGGVGCRAGRQRVRLREGSGSGRGWGSESLHAALR